MVTYYLKTFLFCTVLTGGKGFCITVTYHFKIHFNQMYLMTHYYKYKLNFFLLNYYILKFNIVYKFFNLISL